MLSNSKSGWVVEKCHRSLRGSRRRKAARDYYEGRETGVGEYFVDSLLADLRSLADFSSIHSRHFGFHRMIATHFPFGNYYRDFERATLVVAVLNLQRDPKWIGKQLHRRRTP